MNQQDFYVIAIQMYGDFDILQTRSIMVGSGELASHLETFVQKFGLERKGRNKHTIHIPANNQLWVDRMEEFLISRGFTKVQTTNIILNDE